MYCTANLRKQEKQSNQITHTHRHTHTSNGHNEQIIRNYSKLLFIKCC